MYVCPKWQVSRGMPLFGAISASPMPGDFLAAPSLFREEEEEEEEEDPQRHYVARKRAQGGGSVKDKMLVGMLSLIG